MSFGRLQSSCLFFYHLFGLGIRFPTKFMIWEFIRRLCFTWRFNLPLAKQIQGVKPVGRPKFSRFFARLCPRADRKSVHWRPRRRRARSRSVDFVFVSSFLNNLLGMLPFGGRQRRAFFVYNCPGLCVFLLTCTAHTRRCGLVITNSLWATQSTLSLGHGLFHQALIFVMSGRLCCPQWCAGHSLFANMFGRHMVLATLLIFIGQPETCTGASGR